MPVPAVGCDALMSGGQYVAHWPLHELRPFLSLAKR